MTDESLWPARTVAEYAYCPRLFYYMEVEGVFLPSVDTEKGQAVHRRVNRPSEQVPEKEESESSDRPKAVRSLVLASKALGLTATLDLAEVSGKVAVPVEYRKGRPRRNPMSPPQDDLYEEEDESRLSVPEPWPTDRVQVGLQPAAGRGRIRGKGSCPLLRCGKTPSNYPRGFCLEIRGAGDVGGCEGLRARVTAFATGERSPMCTLLASANLSAR